VRETWQNYAFNALQTVERLAQELGVADRLHLWPDKSFGSRASLKHIAGAHHIQSESFQQWLNKYWQRVSEWPRSV
jgi:hypothetical protein